MLIIYGANLSAASNKVRFVANALGLEYEYRKMNLRKGEHREEWFLKLHPAGKIPVIDDDGFVLFESNAIVKYLTQKHGAPIYSSGLKERAVVDQWLDFGSIHVGVAFGRVLFNYVFAPIIGAPADEQSLKDGREFLDRFLPVVDAQLQNNAYLAGPEITLADFNMLAVLDPAEVADVDLSTFANIVRWRNSLMQKEFYTKCHKTYGEAFAAVQRAAQASR
jgi:glutathione S-transferase